MTRRHEPPRPAPRFRIRYTDDGDSSGCPVFSQIVRAWDREAALDRFYDAPDADGWLVLAVDRIPE